MKGNAIALCLALLLIALPASLAQDNDRPAIAIVQFGPNAVGGFVNSGIINVLHAYGYILADELGQTGPGHPLREGLEGTDLANLNLHFLSADYNFAALQTQVDAALDIEPDIIFAIEEIAAQSVVNATATMEEPPVVLFAAVPNPYKSGIADASCLKPAHISGTHSVVPYDQILPMYLAQAPDLESVGVIFSSNEGSSRDAAEQIAAAGEALGWRVILTGVTGFPDLAPATGGLLSRGVEAIILPNISFLVAGQPIVISVAGEAGVPVFTIGMDGSLYRQGALIGISFNQWYEQGDNLGRIAVAWLNGDIDIAEAGISTVNPMLGYTVNEAYADQWGMELAPEVVEAADIRISEGGRMQVESPRAMQVFGQMMMAAPLAARQEADKAFIESIRCTDEMVAAQQAEMDSAEG